MIGGSVSTLSNVFNFGVIIMELISGKKVCNGWNEVKPLNVEESKLCEFVTVSSDEELDAEDGDDEDDDDDDSNDEGEDEDDIATEYLVRPVARAQDEEDASDFEPEENGEDEDDHDDIGGKIEASSKRKRSDEHDSDDDNDDGGEDDVRPSRR